MNNKFKTEADKIVSMYGQDSGTTRKLLKELNDKQQKYLSTQPKVLFNAETETMGKAPTYNELSEKWGNMDLPYPKRKILREAWDRDHAPKDTTKFADGGKITMGREMQNGIEVEREHAPTLEFLKQYLTANGSLPPLDKLAKSIAVDHEKDFKKISDNPQQSYYQRLIENKLSDEKSIYAMGGSLKPVNMPDPMLEGIRMMAGGGDLTHLNKKEWQEMSDGELDRLYDARQMYVDHAEGGQLPLWRNLSGLNSFAYSGTLGDPLRNAAGQILNTTDPGVDYNEENMIQNYVTSASPKKSISTVKLKNPILHHWRAHRERRYIRPSCSLIAN